MAEETDVIFAVENMYPLRARGNEVVPYAPHWDPTALDVPHITLDLSHTAASGPTPWPWRPSSAAGSRTSTWPTAPGARRAVPDEHLVPGRGGQPCAELLGLLPRPGTRA